MSNATRINWKSIVQKWQHSDLSKADFCRQNNIKIDVFYHQSAKLKAFCAGYKQKINTTQKKQNNAFVKLTCENPPPASSSPIAIRLDCGGSIELSPGFDREVLKRILQVAKSL